MNEFDQHVLAAVRQIGPAYGVELAEHLESQIGKRVMIGSLYAALDRLESAGYVESELREGGPERGYRQKRYYRLSPKLPQTSLADEADFGRIPGFDLGVA